MLSLGLNWGCFFAASKKWAIWAVQLSGGVDRAGALWRLPSSALLHQAPIFARHPNPQNLIQVTL